MELKDEILVLKLQLKALNNGSCSCENIVCRCKIPRTEKVKSMLLEKLITYFDEQQNLSKSLEKINFDYLRESLEKYKDMNVSNNDK